MGIKTLFKGIGTTFIKGHDRKLLFGHDDAGWIEINGKRHYVLTTAITANVTVTTAPVGSIGKTTHATGTSSIFVSDGSKWQAFAAITPLEPAENVPPLTDSSGGAVANSTIEVVTNSNAGYVFYQNITAATTTAGATQLDLNAVAEPSAMSSVVQPDVPRNVVINFTDANASIDAFQVDVVGTAPDGSAVTEQFLFAGGLDQVGSKIFAKVTSFTLTSINGNGAGDLLDVGYGVKLGVPVPAGSTGLSIVKLVANAIEEAASATDATNNSFTATTAPNATNDYEVWFEYSHPAITALTAAVAELAATLNATLLAIKANAVMEDDA